MNIFFYDVAISVPLRQCFTYSSNLKIEKGSRVLVPFGNRKVIGLVIKKSKEAIGNNIEIKKIISSRYDNPEFKKTLLRLKIKGRLPEDAYNSLSTARETIEKQVFFLHWDDSLITREITPADINKMFSKDSFPHTLLMALSKKEEDFEALQEAYEMINEVRK